MLRRSLVLAAAVAALAPTTARGQSSAAFDDYCRIGSIRTCASVRVNTLWDPVALLTRVEIWVSNLQGSIWADNTKGSPITKIGLTAPKIYGASNFNVRTEGNAQTVGNPNSFWSITNKMVEGPITFSATSSSAPQGGILGCDNIPNMPANYFRTCGPTGSGWVVFGFTTQNAWNAASSQIAWQVSTTVADGKWYYACRSEEDPNNVYDQQCESVGPPPVTATPEPVTMALLGSGLLGVAGIRRRRRSSSEELEAVG